MMNPPERFVWTPIGVFHGAARYRQQAPRQPRYSKTPGCIELASGLNFEAALSDLDGFERIWVVFAFHLNSNWKALVSPPLSPDGGKYGVFATRSPHRPNPVGLSCLELERIEGRNIFVKAADLLDGTPILDVKPYIPEIDSFPDSKAGWRDALAAAEYEVVFTADAAARAEWILAHSGYDLTALAQTQLSRAPLDAHKKRVELGSDGTAVLHCRTWRLSFEVEEAALRVQVRSVAGNYTAEELRPGAPDPYSDKEIHRAYAAEFGR